MVGTFTGSASLACTVDARHPNGGLVAMPDTFTGSSGKLIPRKKGKNHYQQHFGLQWRW
jgi:hypothetical protein